MSTVRSWHARWVAICAAAACSGADLTLPGSSEPAALQMVSGDEQRALAGALLGEPLLVRVVDANAHPVHGASVEFKFLGSLPSAGLDPEVAETDNNGHAAAMVRLASVVGEQVIVASLMGSGASHLRVTFRAVALSKVDDPKGGPDDDDDEDSGSGGGSNGGADNGGSGNGGSSDGGSDGGNDDGQGGDHAEQLDVPLGQLPPPGTCRVWFPDRSAGQQPAPESCGGALRDARSGTWVLYRPANRPSEVKVYVIDSRRVGVVVRVLVYDSQNGRFLREEDS
jgi:hypothetical protein